MKDFYEALASSERNAAIPKEDDFFGMLIGSWYIDYMDTATGAVRKGGMAFFPGAGRNGSAGCDCIAAL